MRCRCDGGHGRRLLICCHGGTGAGATRLGLVTRAGALPGALPSLAPRLERLRQLEFGVGWADETGVGLLLFGATCGVREQGQGRARVARRAPCIRGAHRARERARLVGEALLLGEREVCVERGDDEEEDHRERREQPPVRVNTNSVSEEYPPGEPRTRVRARGQWRRASRRV